LFDNNLVDIQKSGKLVEDPIVNSVAIMLREGRYKEGIAYLKSQPTLSLRAMDYLCDAYFQLRNWESAYETLRYILDTGVATPYNMKLEAKILSNWSKYPEALEKIKKYIVHHPGDYEALGLAKICCFKQGNHNEAIKFGQMAITLKDRLVKPYTGAIRMGKGDKKIISYSVWGKQKAYLLGAAINIDLGKKLFPGWISRIYTSASIGEEMLNLYHQLGAEVVLADELLPRVPPYFWRFMAASSPDTRYFLCRDADNRISQEEVGLVDEWLASEKKFHVIRNHILHDDLILAGMWGGTSSPDLDMASLIDAYFNGRITNKYGHDQIFLGRSVWPIVRRSVHVHDLYYWLPGVKSHKHGYQFDFSVGHQNEDQVLQEAKRMKFI
jgi:tetratricopeptide (TPR) repeat protein